MKKIKQLVKYGVSGGLIALSGSALATGESPSAMDQIFGAVDLSSVVTFIAAAGVTIIGIVLSLKAISLAKRLVGKA